MGKQNIKARIADARILVPLENGRKPSTIVHKSRFIGLAAPVSKARRGALSSCLDDNQTRNIGARRINCYAYIIGQNKGVMRYSDDGEPSGTAGKPIIEVMMAKGRRTDCIVVVTRYFGGTLLGTGGLVRAYAHAAASALDKAGVCAMHETVRLQLKRHLSAVGPGRLCSQSAACSIWKTQRISGNSPYIYALPLR